MTLRLLLTSFVLFGTPLFSQAAQPPLKPVAKVDLAKYAGPWRVIAFMDNRIEKGWVDAVESYTMKPQGKVSVHFTYRNKSFAAPTKSQDFTGDVQPDGTNATWKMHLLPLTSASYVIIDIAPGYSVATIAHPSRKFGWILARQKTISPEAWRHSLSALQKQGYDTSKLTRLPQIPAQLPPAPVQHS